VTEVTLEEPIPKESRMTSKPRLPKNVKTVGRKRRFPSKIAISLSGPGVKIVASDLE
jgi:hypothetical protein